MVSGSSSSRTGRHSRSDVNQASSGKAQTGRNSGRGTAVPVERTVGPRLLNQRKALCGRVLRRHAMSHCSWQLFSQTPSSMLFFSSPSGSTWIVTEVLPGHRSFNSFSISSHRS